MEFSEINLSEIQVNALRKKKIQSVEALLRKEPLHYYDFSSTYPLNSLHKDTKDLLENNRPFAITGTCIFYSLETKNHMKMIKMRIEDDATKNLVNPQGTYLFVNIMGYDIFRQSFLSEHPDSPHKLNIEIPSGYEYFTREERHVSPSCKRQIEFINNLDEIAVKDFVGIKTGGKDEWSSAKISDIADEVLQSFVTNYFTDNGQIAACLRWYARGLRLDLAIKKVLLDDDSLLRKLLLNKRVLVGGFIKYDEEFNSFSLLNPVALSTNIDKFDVYDVQYGQVKGITPERYRDIIKKGYENVSSLDFIPTEVCNKYDIPFIKESIRMRHYPTKYLDVKYAEKRAVVEDLLYLALRMELQHKSEAKSEGIKMSDFTLMKKYSDSLPYELTGDQKKAINTIYTKMKSDRVNALVQGDVGTGKTAVAFCLMLIAVSNGYQAALAAPYTTLATQHYKDMLEIAEMIGIKVAFITSEVSAKDKKAAIKSISSGEAQIIIGTHSIFAKDVIYKNLALIIQDEEHKFGVTHREAFKDKALEGFHTVTMSATPIPKSIAATIYDESVDVISIVEKPANRIPIQTAVCKKDDTALDFMAKQIKEGRQCYVVCPSIEMNETADKKIASIEEKEKTYRDYLEAKGMSLAVVTGKIKADEKNKIMQDFKDGKIDVLMATTVIEVGINVPNASVIVITGADRFGFSTLHQLRGRVGRGSYKSYCILQTDESNEKLEFMCQTDNGFEIAKKDLELRGPGSLFGERQSGDNYYISLMIENEELYKRLKETAKSLCNSSTGKDIVRRYEEIYRSEEER